MEQSLIKTLEKAFQQSWNKPAFTDIESGQSFTYGDIATRICYIHYIFEELGIKRGDKIAICGSNCTNWAVSMLAIITYGTVAVPLLSGYSNTQLMELCQHCDAKFMIADKRVRNLWEKGKCPMYLLDIEDLLAMIPDNHTDHIERNALNKYSTMYPHGFSATDIHYKEENPDDLLILSYTSGSTGKPKGVMLSYRSIISNLEFGIGALSKNGVNNVLAILPMAHMFGFAFDFLTCIALGAHLHILTKAPVPKVLMKAFQSIKPNYFHCVPLVMEKITNAKVVPVISTPTMRFLIRVPILKQIICNKIRSQLISAFGGNVFEVIMGGAALSKELEKVLNMIKFPYTVGYGMTECGPIISYSDWQKVRMGSCGQAAPRMTIKIISDDPQNIPGEIAVKGTNIMMGYYKNDEATKETIDEDGWLHTGDLGIIDKDGYLFIRGRKKNMLLGPNGQNVYPEEAEDQVLAHSIFEECVVVSRNNKLVALVYVSDTTLRGKGITKAQLNLNDIRREINAHLPNYCQLSQLELRDTEFEKTPKKTIRRFLYK